MKRLTTEKLAQAAELVRAADVDVWMIFDRETSEGGDPVLPLVLDRSLTWQSALLVARDGRRIAIVGNYDAEPLQASGDWDEVVPYVESIRGPLVETLERIVPGFSRRPRIAVNFSTSDAKADGIRHGMYLLLLDYFRGTRFEDALVSAQTILMPLRSRKTPAELDRIREAIAETERLFGVIASFARVGMTEREVYAFVQERIDERRLGYAWDRSGNPIVNSGPDSMVGHGLPSAEIRIAPGHIFHVDLGVTRHGYSSDIQRCWYVPGSCEEVVPADVGRAFAAVSEAIAEGGRALRRGIAGWQADEAARLAITAAGYPEYMHALGHQVGRSAHDGGATLGPRWERYGETPYIAVQQGEVYTLELGVHVEGRGYLGLEEMVVVTDEGCDWLSKRQSAMALLAQAT